MEKGSYRLRWDMGNEYIEECRIDIERRAIFIESDVLLKSIYYSVKLDENWLIDSLEFTQNDEHIFHLQRQLKSLWVDRIDKKVKEDLKGIDFLDLKMTPLRHTLVLKRTPLEIGEEKQVQVLLLDPEERAYRVEWQNYRRLSEAEYHFQTETESYDFKLNDEGIVEKTDRCRLQDFQKW